jgi:DNA invertase Pin-like site-specific DNA recombinase
MRAAIYTRVSTLDQHTENQLPDLEQFAAARGWTIVQTYTDHGISGSKERRPGLDALIRDARRRRFDALIVWRLDRLGRSLRHLVTLLDELQHLGIAFVALNQAIDTTTPAGRLQMHLLAAFAEYERASIQERVRAGLARVRAKGQTLGRPRHQSAGDLAAVAGLSHARAASQLGVSVASVKRWRREAGSKTPVRSATVSPGFVQESAGIR